MINYGLKQYADTHGVAFLKARAASFKAGNKGIGKVVDAHNYELRQQFIASSQRAGKVLAIAKQTARHLRQASV